jgi:hypothetical protein
MSYNPSGIFSRAGAGGDAVKHWHYKSPDPLQDVEGAGYILNASLIGMGIGDKVMVLAPHHAGQVTAGYEVVAMSPSGAGTIAPAELQAHLKEST